MISAPDKLMMSLRVAPCLPTMLPTSLSGTPMEIVVVEDIIANGDRDEEDAEDDPNEPNDDAADADDDDPNDLIGAAAGVKETACCCCCCCCLREED
jgi:hypothetical protein